MTRAREVFVGCGVFDSAGFRRGISHAHAGLAKLRPPLPPQFPTERCAPSPAR